VLKLCLKDWIAGRWLWLGFVLIFGLYVVQPGVVGLFFPVLGAALVFGSLFVTFALDDRSGVDALYGSLPLKRATVVRGRYALAGFLAAAGGAIVFGTLPLLGVLARARHEEPSLMFLRSAEGVVGFLFVVAPAILIFLPLCFRYGFGRGSIRFVVVTGVLGVLAAAVALPSMPKGSGGNPLRAAIHALGVVRASIGTPLFVAAAVLVTACLTWISLALSLKAYERREL
jgi:hypothetical protein